MSILSSGTRANLARASVTAVVAAAAIGGFAGTAQAANPSMTLSSATGSSSGGNTLTLSVASTATTKFTSGKTAVVFYGSTASGASAATCPGTSATSNAVTTAVSHSTTTSTAGTLFSGTIRYLSTTKVSATVPDLRTALTTSPAAGPTTWLACAYSMGTATYTTPVTEATAASGGNVGAGVLTASSTTSTALIGKAVYTVAAAPTYTSISPTSGPALGGQTVTVTGDNFQTNAGTLTATLGGLAMTGVTVTSNTTFTAVTPAHAASSTAVTLAITTNGGTTSTSSVFTYKNGITVSPSTTPGNVDVDVDVQGVGFSGITFGDTAGTNSPAAANGQVGTNDSNGHVYLVVGAYGGQSALDALTNKTNGQIGECLNVAVISDTELICTIDNTLSAVAGVAGAYTFSGAAVANGTYTLTVVNHGDATSTTNATGYQSVLSSGATFTVADF